MAVNVDIIEAMNVEADFIEAEQGQVSPGEKPSGADLLVGGGQEAALINSVENKADIIKALEDKMYFIEAERG